MVNVIKQEVRMEESLRKRLEELKPGYLRNPSRNTEDSRAEAALYNIAGTAFMDEGLFLNAGSQ